jgi:SAM-dependent methyltransferase
VSFQDHFSRHAEAYAKFRPVYPPELFDYLAACVPQRRLAWDCGTGSGQAALGLAAHFECVLATDPSAQQIAHAVAHARVRYAVAPAESVELPASSVDLVSAAQAAHWFDLAAFYAEVGRVLKPHGVLAIWCYGLLEIAPAVDRVVRHFYHEVVGPYWPAERRHIDAGYRTLPFPFREQSAPRFWIEARWNRDALEGYLQTWSAAERYRAQRGGDPLALLAPALAEAWGARAAVRSVRWPISLRIGRVASGAAPG